MARVLAPLLLAYAVTLAVSGRPAPGPALSALVDDYLDQFSRRHPSIAAGNGLHDYDDRLEDFSAVAVRREVADLKAWQRQLGQLDARGLSADDRADLRILQGIVDGWLLDLETVRTWQRNPVVYVSAVTDGVHNLMVVESAPLARRARQVLSKLAGVPALLAAAKVNIPDPPPVFARHGAAASRGAGGLLRDDLPLAFAALPERDLRERLARAGRAAAGMLDDYADWLERDVLPRATGSFAIGRAALEARYRAEEMIDLPAGRLLALGERELARTQEEFRATAARVDPGRDALAVWDAVLANHPLRGQLVAAARAAVDDLLAFGRARQLLDLPPHEPVIVALAPPFDLGLASMHSSPPLEPTPVKSFYYVTDANPDWPSERQDAWLRKFNYATLSDISAHEVYPGHFAHSLYMRRTPGKIRRIWIGLNPFPQPSSGQDGWAHYAEQLVIDEGFHADDPRYHLAQLSEALTRICRLIASVHVHVDGWTLDQAAALFERAAHLPPPAARQEAERSAYDPTCGGYLLGKMALLKLRRDVERREGPAFDLRTFHARVLADGIAPWWVHRQLLLPGDRGPVIE
jgi:hypothetical protein